MKSLNSIPSSKVSRAGKVAVAGLKVGGNYLKHYGKKVTNQKTSQEALDKDNAADVYNCLSEMKGSALKVAQMLSMDRGALPKAYTDQFAMAQYQSPPLSAPLVNKILKRELGKKPEKVFQNFSPNAERAASIGQVHKAVYKNQEVAIKLQYPGVADSISSDLKLVKPFALKLLKLKSAEVKVYFSGDGGYSETFKALGDQYGPFDIAFIENGAYNAQWSEVHMFPYETVQASIDLKAKVLFPIHWSKFDLSIHPWDEPIIRTTKEAAKKNVNVASPLIGEVFDLSYLPENPWWEALRK